MNQFVLDASVALGWFVDQPVPALALRVRRSLLTEARALVPFFWHLEVANGLIVTERRGLINAQDADRCINDLEQLLLSVIQSRGDLVTVREASELARAYRLTPYDSVYLALAKREGIALATLDQKLRAAAVQAGVEILR